MNYELNAISAFAAAASDSLMVAGVAFAFMPVLISEDKAVAVGRTEADLFLGRVDDSCVAFVSNWSLKVYSKNDRSF